VYRRVECGPQNVGVPILKHYEILLGRAKFNGPVFGVLKSGEYTLLLLSIRFSVFQKSKKVELWNWWNIYDY